MAARHPEQVPEGGDYHIGTAGEGKGMVDVGAIGDAHGQPGPENMLMVFGKSCLIP